MLSSQKFKFVNKGILVSNFNSASFLLDIIIKYNEIITHLFDAGSSLLLSSRECFLAGESTPRSLETTQLTSSIAPISPEASKPSSVTSETHHESAATTKAKPIGPPRKMGSQSASAGAILSKASPLRQGGCICTHHSIHATSNSKQSSMTGSLVKSLLRLIHHPTSFGRASVGTPCANIRLNNEHYNETHLFGWT
jgi:hypothetical protein